MSWIYASAKHYCNPEGNMNFSLNKRNTSFSGFIQRDWEWGLRMHITGKISSYNLPHATCLPQSHTTCLPQSHTYCHLHSGPTCTLITACYLPTIYITLAKLYICQSNWVHSHTYHVATYQGHIQPHAIHHQSLSNLPPPNSWLYFTLVRATCHWPLP